ncbi:uncharacterized protein LOC109016379 isoform X2 [Juglans regia]|uniref:Uncharacterized protein LOC109016379 isoform X2 n=1 Tax=Juglans regia TaxID=51240 RepID=A0A2I4HDW2_JUGRE|nr:uncharacterized protein LOC109016379 isoform X2 [Juglans regia]
MVLHSVSETDTPVAPVASQSPSPPQSQSHRQPQPPMASSVLSSKRPPLRSFAFSNYKWPLDHSTTTNHHHRFRYGLSGLTRDSELRLNYSLPVNEDHRRRVARKLGESTLSAGSEPRVASLLKYDHHSSKLAGSTWRGSESENRNDPVRNGGKNGLPSFGVPERMIGKEDKKTSDKKPVNSGREIGKPEEKPMESDPKSKILIRLRTKNKSGATEDEDRAAEAPAQTSSAAAAEVEEPAQKIWNLRPRKPATKRLDADGVRGASRTDGAPVQETKTQSPARAESARARNETDAKVSEKRPKLSISLSRKEIEEDILVFTGSKPARRPKKRAKNVQKQLDSVFPGLWLGSITPESYRVSDAPAKC